MEVSYTAAVTEATNQIGDALTAGMPIFGLVVALGVGLAFFRKMIRGR